MASADIIEPTGPPSFGDLAGVDACPQEVDGDGFGDGGIEVITPCRAPGQVELDDGDEARDGETDVEGDAGPAHVGAVEGGMPGDDDAANAEHGRRGHVQGATDGLAVKGRVFGRHDGGGDEHGDARVVDASEAFQQRDLGDAVHRVPQRAADEAFAGGDEEDGRHDHVRRRAEREVDATRIKVKRDGQHDHEPHRVRPDVDALIAEAEHGPDAFDLGLAESVAAHDVRIHLPRLRQVLIRDQTMLAGPRDGVFDALLEAVLGPPRPF